MHKVFKTLMEALLAGCALVSCKEAGDKPSKNCVQASLTQFFATFLR